MQAREKKEKGRKAPEKTKDKERTNGAFRAAFVPGFLCLLFLFPLCLPRRPVRWLAAFTTGQFLLRAEPRPSFLQHAFSVLSSPPVLRLLWPARRGVDCLLLFLSVCFLGLRSLGVEALVDWLQYQPGLHLG
jgi:hypothetical protein